MSEDGGLMLVKPSDFRVPNQHIDPTLKDDAKHLGKLQQNATGTIQIHDPVTYPNWPTHIYIYYIYIYYFHLLYTIICYYILLYTINLWNILWFKVGAETHLKKLWESVPGTSWWLGWSWMKSFPCPFFSWKGSARCIVHHYCKG